MLPHRTPFRSRPAPQRRAAPAGSENWPEPWVQLKYFSFHPNIFPNMIASAKARAGDVVTVMDKDGRRFGHGFYNPAARASLRVFSHSVEPLAEDHFEQSIAQALSLRLDTLRLPETTDAFRVIHSDGDRIPGLMVDKLGDVLSIEISTFGVWKRIEQWIPLLHARLGTKQAFVQFDQRAAAAENMSERDIADVCGRLSDAPESTRIKENETRFHVNFAAGHKTGFFCDQRDNRAQFGKWTRGQRVLDLCCYTGGFSVAAKMNDAAEVTGVDLDEKSIEVAKKNANLNQQRIEFVHADAFVWMRQMVRNGEMWDAVVLDPPKLILSREGWEEGKAKYHDLNKLAMSLVKPGGLLLTCSCSGLMPQFDFEEIVIGIAHRGGRKLQLLDRSGAAADHPVMSNCPESLYLKTMWTRVW